MRWAVWLRPSGRRVRVKSCELIRRDGAGGAEGGAELGQLRPGTLLGRLDFEIDDVAAGFGGLEEDFELGVQGAR